jgi:hypothetical protein
MKYAKVIVICLLATFFISSCSDFNSINTDPNAPTKVTSGMLATHIILQILQQPETKGFMAQYFLSKYIGWNEMLQGEQYNRIGRISFNRLETLNNVPKMVEYAPDSTVKKSYEALGHFADAYDFFELTMRVGDIPYSEALKGKSKNKPIYKPKYDTQKNVFLGILNELDKANQLFKNGSNFEGDPVYGGDTKKWQKLVNTFELKVLINLNKKTSDTDLNVIQRFQDIVNNRPIFQSNDDNFQLVYSDKEGQRYPWNEQGNQFLQYSMVSSFLIGKLKNLNDRRLFYYAQPSPVQLKNRKSASDWSAYKGVDVAAPYDNVKKVASTDDWSNVNLRYVNRPAGEPTFLLSYAEMNFILAEAAARGWIAGTGKNYYNKGITAAMHFVANNTPENSDYNHNMPITDSYINQYLRSPKVAFASALNDQIKQIILQKYIMDFLQEPYNAYFEYRRTGYPKLPLNPNTNLNTDKKKFPKRWKYPQDELNNNSKHVHEAINRQFGGKDSFNAKMWILKG